MDSECLEKILWNKMVLFIKLSDEIGKTSNMLYDKQKQLKGQRQEALHCMIIRL